MTAAQAKNIGSDLIKHLTQQRMLYLQLKELAQKQHSLVDGSNPEMLLKVLAGRQRLIDRLTTINRQLKPIRDEWQKVAQKMPQTQRQQAQELVKSVQDILGDIIEGDAQDTKSLQQQKHEIGNEIRSTTVGKHMHQAYAQNAARPQSRFFDTGGE